GRAARAARQRSLRRDRAHRRAAAGGRVSAITMAGGRAVSTGTMFGQRVASLVLRRAAIGGLLGAAIGSSYSAATWPILLDAAYPITDSFLAIVVRPIFQMMITVVLLTGALRIASSVPMRVAAIILALMLTILLTVLKPFPAATGYFEEGGFDG